MNSSCLSSSIHSYDELPYESVPIAGTCAPQLSLASFLHGGPRPPAEGYRAVELGCGDGTNLLPLAFYHPGSTFLGVDDSRGAIERARAAAAAVGVENLRFEVVDLAAPGALLDERFDYVLAHGIWSWVGEDVRTGILDVVGTSTAPDGVVYLSHNVRAGWRVRMLVREMLLDAVEGVEPLLDRCRRAKDLAARLRTVLVKSEHAQQVQLAYELERVVNAKDGYLFHEYLLPVNRPFRHREVAQMLRGRGFAWLCDAHFADSGGREPEGLRVALDDLGLAGEAREEMADFIGCRSFRSSVFARADAVSPARAPASLAPLDSMWVGTKLVPGSGGGFADAGGRTVTPTGALFRAMLEVMAEAVPRFLRIGEVIEAASPRVEDLPDAAAIEAIRADLVTLHVQDFVEIRAVEPRGIGARPGGGPHALARFETRRGEFLTTPLHSYVPLRGPGAALPDAETLARWGLTEPA